MAEIVTLLGRVVDGIRSVVRGFVIFAFAYMTIAVFVQVLGRYVFNYSIAAAVETATWAQVWIVLLGAGLAMRRGMHVSIDILAMMLPLRVARVASVVIAVLCLWFLALVAWGSKALLEVGLFQTSPALLAPMWIIYLGLPIGAFYFALEVALAVASRWDQPFGRKEAVEDVEGMA